MNISNVSSAPPQWQSIAQSGSNRRAKDFQALRSSLQSGDLAGAQAAFANLQKDAPNTSQVTGASGSSSNQPNQSSQIDKDFQTLQAALQSGDLTGAQSAFAALKQDLQSSGSTQGAHRHHHHHHEPAGSDGGSSTPGLTPASTNATAGNASAVKPLLNSQA